MLDVPEDMMFDTKRHGHHASWHTLQPLYHLPIVIKMLCEINKEVKWKKLLATFRLDEL